MLCLAFGFHGLNLLNPFGLQGLFFLPARRAPQEAGYAEVRHAQLAGMIEEIVRRPDFRVAFHHLYMYMLTGQPYPCLLESIFEIA